MARVRGEVDELREVMVDSIDHVLARGERLELLVQKTDNLGENAFVSGQRSLGPMNIAVPAPVSRLLTPNSSHPAFHTTIMQVFKRGAGQLKRRMWWRNARTSAGVAALVVALLYVLAALVCSPTLRHC